MCVPTLSFPGVKSITFLWRLAGSCSKDLTEEALHPQEVLREGKGRLLTLVYWLMREREKRKALSQILAQIQAGKKREKFLGSIIYWLFSEGSILCFSRLL